MEQTNRRRFCKLAAGVGLSTASAGCLGGALGGSSVEGEATKTPPWVEIGDLTVETKQDEYVLAKGDLTFSPDDDDWVGVFRFLMVGYDENDVRVDRTRSDDTEQMDPGDTIEFQAILRHPPSEVDRFELEVWDRNVFRDCDTCGMP